MSESEIEGFEESIPPEKLTLKELLWILVKFQNGYGINMGKGRYFFFFPDDDDNDSKTKH